MVSKFISMKLFYYIILLSCLFSERGDVYSVELLEYKTVSEIQSEISDYLDGQGISIDAEYDVALYKVIYETLDGYGDSALASGVIGIPQSSNHAFGIVSWQHGTVVKRNSVSSVSGFNIISMAYSSSGYIYTEPDYLGLGQESEDFHPYCINIPSANSVIDIIRAARNFSNSSDLIQFNNQVSLVGYSEGGYATLAAQKMMEEELPDEFDITISLPMAGPYDMSGTMVDVMLNSTEPYGKPYYLPYVLLAYIEYYDLGDLGSFFLPEYAEMLPVWFDGYHSDSYIDTQLPNPPIQILLPDLIQEFETDQSHFLRLYLQENDLINWAPQSPTYLFHAIADELIPFENAQVAYDNFIANGSENISLVPIPESYGGHQEAAPFALIAGYQLGLPLQHINPRGDVNIDEQIDISDVIIIVDYIMSSIQLNDYLSWASDMNSDNTLDIIDIIYLINNILQ